MSRFGSTITDSDRKILSSLLNPYGWYSPSPKISPQFEQQSPFGQPFGGQVQGLQSQFQQQQFEGVQQFQQQKPLEQQALQQQGVQQFQQPMQQLGREQQTQQPIQQDISQQQFQQPGMQFQQPIVQQQYQPVQQQQFLPQQQLQQDQFQQGMQQQYQPLQQQGIQQFQQPMQQQLGMDQQKMQPFQKEMLPSDAAFQQGLSTFMGQGPQQLGFFPEMPSTVFFEIRDIDRVGGKEKKTFYEEKHKGKRIPIVETSRDVSLMQGNWNEWQKEAQKCIDKILKLNHKAYNQFQHLQNFKLMESGINYQNDVDNWMNRLKKNLDNLVKENERLRAELPSGSWGSKGGFQGIRGGVDLQVGDAVDSSHVIKPSDIKKSHVTTEKIAQWHPQPEKQTFTEKVKDTAMGFATTVENAALHPIESVGKIASTVEQVALHPIQTVEKAADAVVHTVM